MPKFRVEWIETEERLRFVDVEAPNLKAVEDWWDPNTIGDLESADQNAQPCDTRTAWCDWLDAQVRAGRVSARLAERATL